MPTALLHTVRCNVWLHMVEQGSGCSLQGRHGIFPLLACCYQIWFPCSSNGHALARPPAWFRCGWGGGTVQGKRLAQRLGVQGLEATMQVGGVGGGLVEPHLLTNGYSAVIEPQRHVHLQGRGSTLNRCLEPPYGVFRIVCCGQVLGGAFCCTA